METMATENKLQFTTNPGSALIEEIKDNSPDDLIEDVIEFQRCVLENRTFSKAYKVNSKFSLSICLLTANQENLLELTCYAYALKNSNELGTQDLTQISTISQFLSSEIRYCLMLQSADLFGKHYERGKLNEDLLRNYEKMRELVRGVKEFFVSYDLYKIFISQAEKFDERVKQIIEKVSDPNF